VVVVVFGDLGLFVFKELLLVFVVGIIEVVFLIVVLLGWCFFIVVIL